MRLTFMRWFTKNQERGGDVTSRFKEGPWQERGGGIFNTPMHTIYLYMLISIL